MERRTLNVREIRASKAGGQMRVQGYAATYDQLSNPIQGNGKGSFRERIAKGAFKRILRTNPDVVLLFNHDTNQVLGRTTSGTLRLREDDNGLAFDADLPDTTAGRDVYKSIERGDLNGCSFAFQLGERMEDWEEEEIEDEEDKGIRGKLKRMAKCIVRTIRDFSNLYDVSIVTNPAYPGTTVDARCLAACAEFRERRIPVKGPLPSHDFENSFEDRIDILKQQAKRQRLNKTILEL
jgi:HK97 family phage prohead protease